MTIKQVSKGEIIFKEGGINDFIYLVRQGQVSLFRKIPLQNYNEKNLFRENKVIDLACGDLFGEDRLFFKCPNKYTVKCTAIGSTILMIPNQEFEKYFGKCIPILKSRFQKRDLIF